MQVYRLAFLCRAFHYSRVRLRNFSYHLTRLESVCAPSYVHAIAGTFDAQYAPFAIDKSCVARLRRFVTRFGTFVSSRLGGVTRHMSGNRRALELAGFAAFDWQFKYVLWIK